MSHRRNWLIAPVIPVFLLAVLLTVAAVAKAQSPAPASDPRVVIELTLDPQTYKVTASPDPAALHYSKKEYADWVVAKGSAPFDFTIGIEDQKDPKKRKPSKKLPAPTCTGSGAEKHCKSIVPTSAHKGDQKYSITVKAPSGPVKTDPEVTIDP